MKASVGDRLVVTGGHLGEPVRDAEVLEVRGREGAPPYLVRWSDSGRTGLFFPGPDAVIGAPVARLRKRRPEADGLVEPVLTVASPDAGTCHARG
ncbi:DUF1918 domain-containing protein [Cellulomonas sp. P5_C6]